VSEANNFKNDYDPREMPIPCPFATVRAVLRQISPLLLAYLCARDSRAQAPVDVKLVEERIAARRVQNGCSASWIRTTNLTEI
jgi:hypothetical protein